MENPIWTARYHVAVEAAKNNPQIAEQVAKVLEEMKPEPWGVCGLSETARQYHALKEAGLIIEDV